MNPIEATKRGRPPLPPDQRRTIVVRERVTRAEYRALQKAARGEGISVAAFVRSILLNQAQGSR